MRFIKTYKIFENLNSELESKLKDFEIKNYIINDDGTIDVDGNVTFSYIKLIEIPLNFGKVSGHFYCKSSKLTSLKGCPSEVGRDFNCIANQLTSLEYCPSEIGNDFYCSHNQLTSLEYCPLEIGGDFGCSYNQLTMLDCSSYVKGNIICKAMFEQEPEFFGDCEGKIYWEGK